MKRIRGRPARAASIAAILPLIAGCWWLESEPGPGEWRIRDGMIADSQPHHVASLFEADGSGQLLMECGEGPISLRIATGRDSIIEDISGLPVRYRLDGRPPVATLVESDRVHLWFRDPARAIGEDPMVREIGGARQMIVRIDWSLTDRQILRFDVSRAGDAIERLRRQCAQEAGRKGATS